MHIDGARNFARDPNRRATYFCRSIELILEEGFHIFRKYCKHGSLQLH